MLRKKLRIVDDSGIFARTILELEGCKCIARTVMFFKYTGVNTWRLSLY